MTFILRFVAKQRFSLTARQHDTSGKQVKLDGGSEAVAGRRHGITRHRAAGRESRAAGRHSGVVGDAVVQPEDVAEQRKASGVAGTCSSAAEDVAVRRMPRGMLSGLGKTLRNVTGWQWKSRQPGDAVSRQAEDGTMVGGGVGDRSGGGRRVMKRKTNLEAEDTLEGGGRI